MTLQLIEVAMNGDVNLSVSMDKSASSSSIVNDLFAESCLCGESLLALMHRIAFTPYNKATTITTGRSC